MAVVILKMDAKVVVMLFVATLVAQVAAQTPAETLNALLIEPFCKRVSVRSIMEICEAVIPDKVESKFCEDSLTTSSKGTVSMAPGSSANRICSFTISASNEAPLNVKCTIDITSNSGSEDSVAMYPAALFDFFSDAKAPNNQGGTAESIFVGGATIVTRGLSSVTCTWNQL